MINSNLSSISYRLATIALPGLQDYPRSMISISSDRAYATSWLLVTLALSLTVSKIRPLIARNIPLKIAAKPLQMKTWLLLTVYRKSTAPYSMVSLPTAYDLPFNKTQHDWHNIVHYDLSKSSKVIDFRVILKPICYFLLVINNNLGPI